MQLRRVNAAETEAYSGKESFTKRECNLYLFVFHNKKTDFTKRCFNIPRLCLRRSAILSLKNRKISGEAV
jgi:hypothetical protein